MDLGIPNFHNFLTAAVDYIREHFFFFFDRVKFLVQLHIISSHFSEMSFFTGLQN